MLDQFKYIFQAQNEEEERKAKEREREMSRNRPSGGRRVAGRRR